MQRLFMIALTFLFFVLFNQAQQPKSLDEIRLAFAQDNYDVIKTYTYQGQLGVLAEHRTAINYESKQKKRALYVEGNPTQMGYLVGYLSEPEVSRMTGKFLDNVIFEFIGADVDPDKIPVIWALLKGIILGLTQKAKPDVPAVYIQEMEGIVQGCHAANSNTKVNFDDLLILNVGIDCLLAYIYANDQIFEGREDGISRDDLRIPIMCNAFSVFGNATSDGKHYFGRDFMFPTAKVFEYTACHIIYNPTDGRRPLVSVTAPGFVGSIATMNDHGVAMGVDMSPSGNCNTTRPGLNSLLLVRHATHQGTDANAALQAIIQTPRGVSWDYAIADGRNNKAIAVETGHSTTLLDFLKYPPVELKNLGLIPTAEFLQRYENQTHQNGVMVRWNDYKYPTAFLQFNQKLFEYCKKPYNASAFSEMGYLNNKWTDRNLPAAFYFAPQRENKDDVMVMINHYVVPSMRLCAMNPNTVALAKDNLDDIQWRYDELNHQILENYGAIDFNKARELADFLAPYHKFPEYYQHAPGSSDGVTKVIHGSVSVCNLTDLIIQTHIGFYADEWITITLGRYVGN